MPQPQDQGQSKLLMTKRTPRRHSISAVLSVPPSLYPTQRGFCMSPWYPWPKGTGSPVVSVYLPPFTVPLGRLPRGPPSLGWHAPGPCCVFPSRMGRGTPWFPVRGRKLRCCPPGGKTSKGLPGDQKAFRRRTNHFVSPRAKPLFRPQGKTKL